MQSLNLFSFGEFNQLKLMTENNVKKRKLPIFSNQPENLTFYWILGDEEAEEKERAAGTSGHRLSLQVSSSHSSFFSNYLLIQKGCDACDYCAAIGGD